MSGHHKRKPGHNKRKGRKGRGRRSGETDLRERGSVVVYRNDNKCSSVRVAKGVQFFPDEFMCWGNTDFTTTLTGSTGSPYTLKLNSPINLFGPQVNFTGAFAANVGSGINALISTNTAAGGTQPYNNLTVIGVEYEITVMTAAAAVANTTPFLLGAFPTIGASFAGMSISQFKEQPMCVYAAVPASATEPVIVRGYVDMSTIFGVPKSFIRNNYASYGQIVGSDPINVCYLQVYAAALDGATNVNLTLQWRFNIHYLFRKRNNLNTTVPTLSKGLSCRAWTDESSSSTDSFDVVNRCIHNPLCKSSDSYWCLLNFPECKKLMEVK